MECRLHEPQKEDLARVRFSVVSSKRKLKQHEDYLGLQIRTMISVYGNEEELVWVNGKGNVND